MKRQFEPRQYNFERNWLKEIRKWRNMPALEEAFDDFVAFYEQIAEMKYEDHSEIDPEQAKAEYDLDMHTAQVKRYDLHWLRDCIGEYELAKFCLVLAGELFPEKTWDIVEGDEYEYFVVTDDERTMVFDLKNCNKLSAGASLVLAADKKYVPTDLAVQEANAFMESRYQRLTNSLEIMKGHLAEHDKRGEILEFEKP